MVDGSGDGDIILLRHTVLVPAYIGEDQGIFRKDGLAVAKDALRGHREAVIVADRLILLLEVGLVLSDLLAKLGTINTIRADFLRSFKDLCKGMFQVSDRTDLYRIVAADLGRIDIDLHELGHALIECYALVPGGAVSLCHTGSEDQDMVGCKRLLMGKLKSPETGLSKEQRMRSRDAALAHKRTGYRNVKEVYQCFQLFAGLCKQDAAAGMDQRVLCLDQGLRDLLCSCRIKGGLDGLMRIHIGPLPYIVLDLTGEHIHGNRDQDRAGTAGLCKTECLVQYFRECFGTVNSPGSLYEGLVDIILGTVAMHVHFLMGMLSIIIAGNITGDDYHGDGVKCGIGNTCGRIGKARAKVADHDTRLMGNTCITVSCCSGDLLMADTDISQLRGTAECIQHGDNSMTAKTKYILNTSALQIVDDAVGN